MTEDFDESFYESRPHSADKQNNMTVTTSTPGNEVADVDASVRQAGSKRPHSVGHDEIVHNGPSPKNRLPAYERHLQRAFSPNREQPKLNSGFNVRVYCLYSGRSRLMDACSPSMVFRVVKYL